jgi:hypothetical protein
VNETLPGAVPATVGGWAFDGDRYNGFAWFGGTEPLSVHVHPCLGTTTVRVADERIGHSGGHYYIGPEGPQTEHVQFGADDLDGDGWHEAFEAAVAWMEAHDPTGWTHPVATPAVFDTPPGYSLDAYQVTERQVQIHYERDTVPADQRRDTLFVGGYRSSDNYHLLRMTGYEYGGLPLRADDPDVDFPAGTSLEAALARTRTFARTAVAETGHSVETSPDARPPVTGQSSLSDW